MNRNKFHKKYKNITGLRFGRLVVIERVDNLSKSSGPCWKCVCDCGRVKIIRGGSLIKGLTRSCGCLHSQIVRSLKGSKSAAWKGGRRYKNTYVYLYDPNHPNSTKDGCVAEHIKIMSQSLGRPLRKGETIHHINGIRTDNRIDNLELWTSYHHPGQRVIDLISFALRILRDYPEMAEEIVKKESKMPDSPKKTYSLVGLGSGKTLVSITPEGTIQAIKADVELSIHKKDVVIINDNPVITASGFDKLNKVACVSLPMPSKIEVPGHGIQPNPFFIVDNDTGGIRFVMAKMSAVGFSPVGNLAVVDQTLMFDLLSYFKMDCLAKIKKIPGFGKVTHRDNLTAEEQKKGYFIPILDKNYGIWMNTTHPEFIKVINDHSQRQRFAERIALGILKRNCLRHHPAIGVMNVQLEEGGTCKVPILAWRKDIGMEEIRNITEDTGARETAGAKTVKADVLTTEELSPEETAVDITEAVTEPVKPNPSEADKEAKVINPIDVPERERTEISIGEMRTAIGETAWEKFYREKVPSGRSMDEFSDEELKTFWSAVRTFCRKLGK